MNCLTKLFKKLIMLYQRANCANCDERIVLIDRNITIPNQQRESVIIECTLLLNDTLDDIDHEALVSVLDSFIHDDE